ncbi:MAG: VWA domain-containing protein [Acidobacteria bacterium]|nr:VWA domain-containing protein [Acidobacteriota bacterium]
MRKLIVAALGGLLATAGAVPLAAQEPAPAPANYQIDAGLLELEVRVTDKKGRPVDSLEIEDFAALEDGAARRILSLEYVPATRGAQADPTAVEPNRVSRVLILLDAPPTDTVRVVPAVRRFIRDRLPPGLLVSLQGLAFTDDKEELLDQLERRAWTRDALTQSDSRLLDASVQFIGQVQDYAANVVEDQYGRSKLFRYLSLMEGLAEYPGRKSVALFSQGFPVGYNLDSQQFSNLQDSDLLRRMRGEATRNRIHFYTVDVRGLKALSANADASYNSATPEVSGPFQGANGGSLGAGAELQLQQNGLVVIANQTGGEAFISGNDLGKAFDAVARDEGGYYLLSYMIPPTERLDQERNIEIKVARPDVQLEYQRRYYDQKSFEAVMEQARESRSHETEEMASPTTDKAPAAARDAYRKALDILSKGPNELDAAIRELERATSLYPKFALAWTLLGNLRVADGDSRTALDAFERAIKADADFAPAYRRLARTAEVEGDWKTVRATARRWLKEHSDDPAGLFELALSSWNLGDAAAAAEAAQKVIDGGAAASFPRARLVLGLAEAAQGRPDEAARQYESYLELARDAPDRDAIEERLAEWHAAASLEEVRNQAAQGRWQDVAAGTSLLIEEERQLTGAHFFFALAQYNLGDLGAASAHADLAAARPDAARLPEIAYLRGLLAADRGDLEQAAREFRAYLAAQPESPFRPALEKRLAEWAKAAEK